MKVFISWSGPVSHRVAVIFRDWLPSVIQSIEPYVSSEDIDKGTRWSTDIAGELHASTYGLICLTKDNLTAPWINFEAGALGKSIDKSRVSPFLFRLKRSEVAGPVLQFQSTIFERDDVFKLLKSINVGCGEDGLTEVRLEKTFEVWWPQLERLLNEVHDLPIEVEVQPVRAAPSADEAVSRVLEEVLELTRNNHRLLRDPMAILPAEYLQHVLQKTARRDIELDVIGNRRIHLDILSLREPIRDAMEAYRSVLKFLNSERAELERASSYADLLSLLRRMDSPLRYLSRELGLRLPREVLEEHDEL